MKFTDYLITFFVIFCCFAFITFFFINRESKVSINNTEYANALTIACHDASKTIKNEKIMQGVWAEKKDREYTLNTFYDTLRFCFNTELTNDADQIYQFIPIICLIDNNGYYISYNSAFDYGSNHPVYTAEDHNKTMTCSTINTWTKNYGDYIVRFYLNDYMEIIIPVNGHVIRGNLIHSGVLTEGGTREELVERMKDPDDYLYYNEIDKSGNIIDNEEMMKLFLLNSTQNGINYTPDEWYDTVKAELITQSINQEVTYYINHQNIWGDDLGLNYQFTMPEIAKEDWHRLLTNPTVISFLQGRQSRSKSNYLNIYSLGGGEVTKGTKYFITDDGLYHVLREDGCKDHVIEHHLEEVTKSYYENGKMKTRNYKHEYYTCDGEIIENTFDSMGKCAELGALPDECVKNHNLK